MQSTDTIPTPKVNRIFANKDFLSQSERKPTNVATKRTLVRTRNSSSPIKGADGSPTKKSLSSPKTIRLTRSKGNLDSPRTRSKVQSKTPNK